MKRRDFIKRAAAATGAGIVLPGLLPACRMQTDAFASADAMDEALQMMSKLPPLGNHGPMAAEALIALGRPERTIRFVESYKNRFNAIHPTAVEPVSEKNWKAALGRGERNLDWTTFFSNLLRENEWAQVVEKWTAILAPGLCAAAGHGVIRTCHAVRSLSLKPTELRRRELAEGLGYWAAYYQPLPTAIGVSVARTKPQQAIDKVPVLPSEKRLGGSIMNQLKALDSFRGFSEVIGLVETTGKADVLLSELTETFAAAYLRNVSDQNNLILLHAVTATAGLRSLLPYLTPATTQTALAYGWQAAAGLFSIGGTGKAKSLPKSGTINKEDLIEQAAASNEEHAIKFIEACLREFSINPNPVYLQAASEGLRQITDVLKRGE